MLGSKRILVDSDTSIGLLNQSDELHERALKILESITRQEFGTITPFPIVLEAAITLAKDKTIKRPDLAKKLLSDYSKQKVIKLKEANVTRLLSKLYGHKTSKRNSPFNFYLLALAKVNGIKYIFSFDLFYKKQGLTLAEEIVVKGSEID